MQRLCVRIDSLHDDPTGRPGLRLVCPSGARPSPGQFALALRPGRREACRTALFPTRLELDGFEAELPDGADWSPGDRLDLLSPLGSGFVPPPAARHWLLAALATPARRLMPLLIQGLARGAAVALYAPTRPAALPPEVELIGQLSDGLGWADYLAVDVGPQAIGNISDLLRSAGAEPETVPPAAQALVAPPMPCGLGVCAACAVPRRAGWSLACLDGPVFDLGSLRA